MSDPPREAVAILAGRLEASARTRLGRSLAVFPLDTGDCGGCTLELRAAAAALARHGIRLAASPAEADALLVSGAMTRNMQGAVAAAWAAMGEPRWLVAIGDCAVDGGVFRGSPACLDGLSQGYAVDLVVKGCPPAPARILLALRSLLEANAR